MAIEITADNIRKNTEEKDKMADNQTKTDNKKKKKTRSNRQTQRPDRSLPRGRKPK
jgi:hypothetical protein